MKIDPDKLVYAQTVLRAEDIQNLKLKSRSTNIKDALTKAVHHYLNCPGIENDGKK